MRKNYLILVLAWVCVAGTAVLLITVFPLTAQTGRAALFQAMRADRQPAQTAEVMQQTTCTNGMAGEYPCQNVTLLAHMPLNKIGGGEGDDSGAGPTLKTAVNTRLWGAPAEPPLSTSPIPPIPPI